MSAPSTSGLSVGLLLRVLDVKYGCLLYLLYFTLNTKCCVGISGTKSGGYAFKLVNYYCHCIVKVSTFIQQPTFSRYCRNTETLGFTKIEPYLITI